MKVHTSLSRGEVAAALKDAIDRGHVAASVYIEHMAVLRSRSHAQVIDVRLSALPGSRTVDGVRHRLTRDRTRTTASRDEWGWFLAEVFQLDPEAKVDSLYRGEADFHRKTASRYAPSWAVAAADRGRRTWVNTLHP